MSVPAQNADTYLAKGALPDGSQEVKMVKIDFAIEINWLGAAAEDGAHKIGRTSWEGTGRTQTYRLEEQDRPERTRTRL